jgi:curved DNA-binding protein CbpA
LVKDYYKILGLQRECSQGEIKSAYRKLAFRYHPDFNKSQEANYQFMVVNEAYRVLSNETIRRSYDYLLSGANPPVPKKPADVRKYGTAHKYRWKKEPKPPEPEPALVSERIMFYAMILLGILSIVLSINDLLLNASEGLRGITGIAFGVTFTGLLVYGWYEFLNGSG